MKYVLRVLVVIAMIVGIVFGISYCNNRKSTTQQFQSDFVLSVQTKDNANEKKDLFLSKIGMERYNYQKELENLFNNIEDLYSYVENYAGEIYLIDNISNDDLNKMKSLREDVENARDDMLSKMQEVVKIVEKGGNVDDTAMSDLHDSIIHKVKVYRLKFAYVCQFTLNYVKINVRNDSNNDGKLANTIDTVNSLTESYKEDR